MHQSRLLSTLVIACALVENVEAFSVALLRCAPQNRPHRATFVADDRRSIVAVQLSGEDNLDAAARGKSSSNVLGTTLMACCENVQDSGIGTGFYRDGFCSTGQQDLGRHTVCVQVTEDFLNFSKQVGNDLSTPVPQYLFPGLKEGDIWCLCAQRWVQALEANAAPKLYLQSTHEKTLDYVGFDVLREYALDKEEADKALDDLNEQRLRLKKLLE